jgi:hypothetical protein
LKNCRPTITAFATVAGGGEYSMPITLGNEVVEVSVSKSANASDVTLSNAKITADEYLIITVPPNADRVISLLLQNEYLDGSFSENYILIIQE